MCFIEDQLLSLDSLSLSTASGLAKPCLAHNGNAHGRLRLSWCPPWTKGKVGSHCVHSEDGDDHDDNDVDDEAGGPPWTHQKVGSHGVHAEEDGDDENIGKHPFDICI